MSKERIEQLENQLLDKGISPDTLKKLESFNDSAREAYLIQALWLLGVEDKTEQVTK